MGNTSTKCLARKRETNQYNTAKLRQPRPNRAVPKHRPESWEKVVNMYRNIDRTLTNAAIWKFTDNSHLTEERLGFRFQGRRGHKTAHSTSPLDSSCSEGEKEQLMKRIHEPKPSLQMLHTSVTYTIKMFLSWFLSRLLSLQWSSFFSTLTVVTELTTVKRGWNSSVGRTPDWKARCNTDPGSSPQCSKGLFSQSNSTADSYGVQSVQPLCAITCINICVLTKNPKHWQSYQSVWTHKILYTLTGTGSAVPRHNEVLFSLMCLLLELHQNHN